MDDLFLRPIQPYFVFNTTAYYKKCMYHFGISHFYEFTCNCVDFQQTLVVPDGTVDIIFCCSAEHPDAWAHGSVNFVSSERFIQGRTYFGVRFLPGLVRRFCSISPAAFSEGAIRLTDLEHTRDLVRQITAAGDFRTRIGIFLKEALPLVRTNIGETDSVLTRQILEKINRCRGNLSLKDLEDSLFYSERQLRRVFYEHTGMSLKKYARYIRFQAVLQLLRDQKDLSILEISEESGYYDQNHLQKEFWAYAGSAPGAFRETLARENYLKRLRVV